MTDGVNDATQDTFTKTAMLHMRQSIKEWTKQNLWKTAFKKLKEFGLPKSQIMTDLISNLSFFLPFPNI